METVIRKSDERGFVDHGWLKARHSFSFGSYYDANHLGFGDLRVINEDRIAAGRGFGMHPHQDMEILTYILSGSLSHKDSMGNESVIRRGEIQRMSAGTGVVHSELNDGTDETHLFQIWINPAKEGLEPSYEQKMIPSDAVSNKLCLIASDRPAGCAVKIHQHASVYASRLDVGASVEYQAQKNQMIWIQLASGEVAVGEETLKSGDGIGCTNAECLNIVAREPSEFLLFELPV